LFFVVAVVVFVVVIVVVVVIFAVAVIVLIDGSCYSVRCICCFVVVLSSLLLFTIFLGDHKRIQSRYFQKSLLAYEKVTLPKFRFVLY